MRIYEGLVQCRGPHRKANLLLQDFVSNYLQLKEIRLVQEPVVGVFSVCVSVCLRIPGKRAGGCPQTPAANSSTLTASAAAAAEQTTEPGLKRTL